MTTLTAPLCARAEQPADVGELTLGQRLAGAWQELHAHGAAACPVCGDRVTPAGDAGRCDRCGSELR
jgi:hypothetical protein